MVCYNESHGRYLLCRALDDSSVSWAQKIPYALASVGVLMAVGIWLERFVVNMASVHTYHMHKTGLPLGFIEIGMALGFLGIFVFTILKVLGR